MNPLPSLSKLPNDDDAVLEPEVSALPVVPLLLELDPGLLLIEPLDPILPLLPALPLLPVLPFPPMLPVLPDEPLPVLGDPALGVPLDALPALDPAAAPTPPA